MEQDIITSICDFPLSALKSAAAFSRRGFYLNNSPVNTIAFFGRNPSMLQYRNSVTTLYFDEYLFSSPSMQHIHFLNSIKTCFGLTRPSSVIEYSSPEVMFRSLSLDAVP
jgi:hypothetical protein